MSDPLDLLVVCELNPDVVVRLRREGDGDGEGDGAGGRDGQAFGQVRFGQATIGGARFGEAAFGQIRFGQVEQLVDAARLTLGSSGAITASAAAAQGVRTAVCGVVGADHGGDLVRELLTGYGVDIAHVRVDPALDTGLTVVLARADGDRAMLTFPGAMSALRAIDVPAPAVAGFRHIHVSSIHLQTGLIAGLSDLLAARPAGVTASLDPGWDPSEQWTAVLDLLPHLDLLLPNAAECLAIAAAARSRLGEFETARVAAPDTETTLTEAAGVLAGFGPTVVVKCGARGAVSVSPAGAVLWVRTEARPSRDTGPVDTGPLDTTGAGDNFDAGYLAAILDGGGAEAALARAVASGSICVTGLGGTGAMATAAEAIELAARLPVRTGTVPNRTVANRTVENRTVVPGAAGVDPAQVRPDVPDPARPGGPMTVPAGFSTVTEAEVFSQPEVWARVISESPGTDKVLPRAGTPVLFVGCGTSYYIGSAYAAARNAAGLGRTRAAIASEVDLIGADDTVVVLSRSGTTRDVIDLVGRVRAEHRVIGIIGAPDSPLVDLCDEVVLLDYADEQSVVQTRFATSALTVLRASLGQDLSTLSHQAQAALAVAVPAPLPKHVVFLGAGWTLGLAHEAALKCIESAGVWAEAYAAREYQHGPISAAGPDTLVWSFTELTAEVGAPIVATGATVVHLDLDPQAALVGAHRLALALAAEVGRDPDRPVYLARSVQAG